MNFVEPYEALFALLKIPDPTDRARALGDALHHLPEVQAQLRQARQDAVLEMRAAGMSHADVADKLGITRSRAQQIAEGKTKTWARKPAADE